MKSLKWITFALLGGLLVSCGGGKHQNYNRAVYMLVDVSGTYVKEVRQANKIIRILISQMNPGDSFMLAKIDSNSFSEKDVVVNVTFDDRRSVANKQKLQAVKKVDHFTKTVKSSRYTDITGGILQAVEYLERTKAGFKTVVIFSDLREEVTRNQYRKVPLKLNGIRVVSINVKKLKSDARDPRRYYRRLKVWEDKVKKGKGTWDIVAANEKHKIISTILK